MAGANTFSGTARAENAEPIDATRHRPITIMVVDDSAVIRGLFTRILENEPDFRVVTSAANGRLAVQKLREQPVDIIVLDLDMPVMDGLTALPVLLESSPNTKVIIASTLSTPSAELTMKALAAGASDYVPKPSARQDIAGGANDGATFRRDLVTKVRHLARHPVRAGARPAERSISDRASKATLVLAPRPLSEVKPEIMVIGSSTGGPEAIIRLLSRVHPGRKLPTLITQHMPAKFTTIFAEHIARNCDRPCREGRDGETVLPGQTYVAPGGLHMKVDGSKRLPVIRLSEEPPENFCRPAVDVMFRSVARIYGAGVLAIVLTGIGADGTAGGRCIVEQGGVIIAQDEASSVVWGMPGSAARAGICSAVLPLDVIADRVNALTAGVAT